MERKIRYAVMCKGPVLEKWQADALLGLQRLEGASLELLITDQKANKSFFKKITRNLTGDHSFWNFFLFTNRKRFKSAVSVEIAQVLHKIPMTEYTARDRKNDQRSFTEEQIKAISSLALDFILTFEPTPPGDDILNVAKFGVWAFQFGDRSKYRGGPPFFWEIYDNDPVTSATLVRVTRQVDSGIILKSGFLKTKYSYIRNRDQMLLECSRWPAMICKDLLLENTAVFTNEPVISTVPARTAPGNFQYLSYLCRVNFFQIKKVLHGLFYIDFWNVGLVKGHISEFLKDENPDVEWFPVESNKVFIADPFAWPDPQNNSKLHLFFETYSFKKRKGYIEYACYDSGFGKPVMVIEEDTHMSYPYLVSENNEVLISTEDFHSSTVQVYRPTSFPLKWEKGDVLFNQFPAIDSTIFQSQGLYWMFNSDRKDGIHHNLHLFYADRFAGPWTPHPQNPVKTDIRSARCAGTPFVHEGFLFRPSMDYSEKKQGRVVLNKITTLSRTVYAEVSVKTISPYHGSRYPDKMHTLSAAGNYTLIDGAREAFIFSDPIFLRYKISATLSKLAFIKHIRNYIARMLKIPKFVGSPTTASLRSQPLARG